MLMVDMLVDLKVIDDAFRYQNAIEVRCVVVGFPILRKLLARGIAASISHPIFQEMLVMCTEAESECRTRSICRF